MPSALPLAILIVCGILYHVAQKGAAAASPWAMLAVAYGAAFVLTLVLALVSGEARRWHVGRVEWVGGLMVGLAALGIEASFLFGYRAGWKLAGAAVIANVSVTAILALIGVTVFREHLTVARAAGLALATGGAALIARG